ncbi:transketolase : Transketolase OS=Granulibacter bethesdensis CGDNIH3 GN=GbCGDNIH3_0856 PE=4 SV=1: Transketolase_N: Transket_pyr: Transketolase_C [Gemmata massiliana]|uniref:Transketolase n=1 Tax=Gemmata massiliana TaxID=1210884 RepID=A0A6P2DJW0_9BACT|nr:transketolase [Gemmata massiliana]VTS02559.1 transketolase : Transketolase OS=Granulibacter bethesdensis CGDNIH3 GN=GbCGDNIH3_0856 PE=4 SV=1: Transketolase_N: Transket_pyr: Transketolase_C [Gemmata massiliana]
MSQFTALDVTAINTIRTLAMDAVQKANSGHPGAPMGLAPVAYTLWNKFLSYDPADPMWPNRDRFVLSNGHASMLIYSLIHLAGIKNVDHHGKVLDEPSLPLDQLKQFRQLNSKTPGHPENEYTAGVETTTGPLGQGVGNAVGMAIAQKWLAAHYGRPGFEALFEHRVYAICGDGCMMEGVASEAASLGGHLKLNNLTLIYDDNGITIDGHTHLAFSEDVPARFAAYGWNVLRVTDGNDLDGMAKAIEASKSSDRPTLIALKTVIGYGSPNKADTHAAHGEPLGPDEIKLTKKAYGWPEDSSFLVPDGVYDLFKGGIGKRGAEARAAWQKLFTDYKSKFPKEAAELEALEARDLPAGWDKDIPVFPTDAKGLATRESSGTVLNAIAKHVPWMVGGSADLNPSTKTFMKFPEAGVFTSKTPGGRNVHFGVREHGMGAIMNGMALSKLRSYGSGFLIFSDYGRPPIRLAAIMGLPVLYVFTHDSIGVGEDGPTHQPIEQIMSLRAIPKLILIRPGDANEVAEAYKVALQEKHHPVILAMTRQALPTLDRTKYAPASGLAKGGYALNNVPNPDVLLIGTGSELSMCADAAEKLATEGIKARVVSLPSWELFEKQDQAYRDSVIPPAVTARVCVEMGGAFGWERFAGSTGAIIGMRSFGASAPLKDLLKHFGFTVEAVVKAAKEQVGK